MTTFALLRRASLGLATAATASLSLAGTGTAQEKPLNFLIIWGDDVGYWNVSAYNQGMMGYETPNIDRIAN